MGMRMMTMENPMYNLLAYCVVVSVLLVNSIKVMPAQQVSAPQPPVVPAIRIGSGDMIDVTVYDSADLSGRYRVNENGDISVPLLGQMSVQGKTADEVQRLIEKSYIDADVLRHESAHATVFISEYATQGVVVTGEVKAPGVYPALGVRMLNDILTTAGGVTAAASSSVVIWHHDDPGHPFTVEYNPTVLSPVVPQVQILPGDTVMVPKAGMIYVVGNVNHPGGYVLDMRTQMTVEKAIALAEGQRAASSLKHAQLVHTQANGKKEMRVVDITKINEGKNADVAMQDGDILYVPRSGGKAATMQALTSMLGIGTTVVTYRASYR